ncbi:MinD/ParA family protein [Dissulfurirhabdus thermomarina]|uniref:MinD/ParA family protein n=1 Tax=Dissulfurirhabdus thermomarina TaxID=1765737 RepID=A0A6N9TJZ5_DISTH|nr:P-loop NTPase [Dissulfurirhabdus thermomarina]NDY41565.1 MinD/ParA family protein [Dissulfurirhabdus thermomarina]NMX22380.1 MinD/ParA family protein [Dissulfurirhabdus thermomarina]
MNDGPEKTPLSAGPRIWAVGGGKGGVGKSVITANIAIALAREGHRCVLVDADLGGANLHTLMGISGPERTLADFIARAAPTLDDVAVETAVPGLRLISGALAQPDGANLGYAQKMKIFRHLKTLRADFVLLDLGAGSAFNTLDFFLAAQEGVLVIVPSPTSIENAYHFIKAAYHRKVRTACRDPRVALALETALKATGNGRFRSPRDLVAGVAARDPEAGRLLQAEARTLAPRLIVNQVRKPREQELGHGIATACRDFFGIDVRYLGHIRNDDAVWESVQARRPTLEAFPESPFSRSVREIARRLRQAAEEAEDG